MLLGGEGELKFTQDVAGLHVTLPAKPATEGPYVLRLSGLNP
jgi:hypothetical protein